MTKRILSAIAQVLPDDGHHYLTEVDIRPGWGDVLNVHLHTTMPHTEAGREFERSFEMLLPKRSKVSVISSKLSGEREIFHLGDEIDSRGTFGPTELSIEARPWSERFW